MRVTVSPCAPRRCHEEDRPLVDQRPRSPCSDCLAWNVDYDVERSWARSTRGRRALAAGDVKLSVVIPARNEAETIEHTLREIADNLESLGIEHEIIVVDDASSDGTAFVVERTAAQDPRVRCLRSHFSHGFGFAVRSGLEVFQATEPATPPPPNAWPTTTTRSSFTCATRPGTAAGGDRPICSKGRWARSNAGRR